MPLKLAAIFTIILVVLHGYGSASVAEGDNCRAGPVDLNSHVSETLGSPAKVRSKNGILEVVLDVKYDIAIVSGCQVTRRSYNGEITGPTLILKPGDTLKMTIRNQLPENPDQIPDDINEPHHFNTTNIHTHGLHVDPSGIADNVMRKMLPGGDYEVIVEIPKNHAPGTFWYHPHLHGSTAIQVASGMSGALIIEGGLDHVPEIAAAKEQIMLFQQIPFDENGKIEEFHGQMDQRAWLRRLQRNTTINGSTIPIIHMRPGEVQRWRMIHGGVKIPLDMQLEGHRLIEIATDGIATGRCDAWRRHDIYPGYRSDVLVKARDLEDGQTQAEYWLTDDTIADRRVLIGPEDSRQYLSKVIVSGEPLDMDMPCAPNQLAELAPFEPVTDSEITGEQELHFSIERVGERKFEFTVDGKPFGKGEVRQLKLGDVEEWTLSARGLHPFHIHVNPFQVTRGGPDGRPQIVWKDTLAVFSDFPQKVRMRYEDFTGRFMLHCHFLDHEDLGMMQTVEIIP